MSDLRSRHYLGTCGGMDVGMRVTETTSGQFDDKPDEPFEMHCGPKQEPYVMRPVTEAEYAAWDAETGDDAICEMDWTATPRGLLDVPCGEPATTTVELDGITYDACNSCATWIATRPVLGMPT
jgi:hypothetical protein